MSAPLGFILKKAVAAACMPLGVCLLFLGAALVYALLRRPREAIAPCVLGTFLLYFFSLQTVATLLVSPLERQYPPLHLAASDPLRERIKWVVVLGSGHWTGPDLPAAANLDESALFRLVEGIRLARQLPQAVLVLSGGRYRDEQSNAQVMAAAATDLGFDPGRMLLEDTSLDTHDEAMRLKDIVGADPFVLVTSAAHMLRAVKLFEHLGLSPVPAPALFHAKGEPETFAPYPDNLHTAHLALHEYLGLAWAFARGQISFSSP
ncbi:envelope biogenesis factor ElyC [Desulfovibrionales bacterium]